MNGMRLPGESKVLCFFVVLIKGMWRGEEVNYLQLSQRWLVSVLLEVDAPLGDGFGIREPLHNFKKSEMSAVLFQHFMDGYMKLYNFPIISRTMGSQWGGTNKWVPNQWL